jgi:hypothetical protein
MLLLHIYAERSQLSIMEFGMGGLLMAQTMRELTDHNHKRPSILSVKQNMNYERAKRDKELMNLNLSSLI